MFRIIQIVALTTLALALPAQKKGIFDELYDEFDLMEELPESDNRDYEIVYDTRQKGDENYRLHIDGVEVIFGEQPQMSQDLLSVIEQAYVTSMVGGTGMTEETAFIIGGSSSTTTKKEEIEAVTTGLNTEDDKIETSTAKPLDETKKSTTITTKAPKIDFSNLKRNTDLIKRRFKISDIIQSFFHNKKFAEN